MYKLYLVNKLLKIIFLILLMSTNSNLLQAKEQKEPFILGIIDMGKNISYQLMKNGHIIESGVTDAKGQVLTSLHENNKKESWLIRSSRGVYGVYLPENIEDGKYILFRSIQHYLDIEEVYNPSSKNGYVAFNFFGINSSYSESEPYWIYHNNKLIDSGITGYSSIGGVSEILTIPTIINSFKILTCSDTVFSVERKEQSQSLYALTNYFDVTYDDSGKIKLNNEMKKLCQEKKSWQLDIPENPPFNDKKPFLNIGIVPYKSEEQREQLIDESRKTNQITAENKQKIKEQIYLTGNKRFSGKGGIAPIGVCPDDLLGTFGIPANLPDSNIMDIAHTFYFSDSILAGDTVFKLYAKSGSFYRIGMKSGSINQVTIAQGNSEERGVINGLMKDKFYCYANFGDAGDHSYIHRMDYIQMSPKQFEELRQYLGHIWGLTPSEEDLKNIHYLYGVSIVEPGIGGASYLIPLERIEK